MNLRKLTDDQLLLKLEVLGYAERKALVTILHCLLEVERRKLYSEHGYTSLFDYCVRSLKYSEDQAQRRIVAARMMKELPEIEPGIARGDLSLTVIGMAHSHFRREQIESKRKKLEILERLEGNSSRNAEKALAITASSPALNADKIKHVTAELVEIRCTAKADIMEKIEILRGALAHEHPHLSIGGLFELLSDWGLEKTQRNQPAAPRVTARQPLRKQVLTRDQYRCTHCGSPRALELDHIIPQAKGGATILENLRTLCRPCNQRAAINEYGMEKMEAHLKG